MGVTQLFKNKLNEARGGNLDEVRIILKDKLIYDAVFGENTFKEYEDEAKLRCGQQLYEKHDEEGLKNSDDLDKSTKDELERYFYEQLASVVRNFSVKRIEMLKELALRLARV